MTQTILSSSAAPAYQSPAKSPFKLGIIAGPIYILVSDPGADS